MNRVASQSILFCLVAFIAASSSSHAQKPNSFSGTLTNKSGQDANDVEVFLNNAGSRTLVSISGTGMTATGNGISAGGTQGSLYGGNVPAGGTMSVTLDYTGGGGNVSLSAFFDYYWTFDNVFIGNAQKGAGGSYASLSNDLKTYSLYNPTSDPITFTNFELGILPSNSAGFLSDPGGLGCPRRHC